MDVAELGFKVDTSDIKKGSVALEQLGTAAQDAAKRAGIYTDAAGRMREANGRFVTNARKAELGLSGVGREAQAAGKRLDAASKDTVDFSAAMSRAGTALAAFVTIGALRYVQQLSEQFVLLESRVKRLSESTDDAAITFQRLAQISAVTGASLADTVKLWEALNLTLKDLGGNESQVLRLTETLQKIGTVGGSSAEDMSNALRQLGQAIAGGVVRAEEFNSILDGMPQLAREIAAGLGVPFGELRTLMLDGGLTAERVLRALQERGASVDAEFAKIPRTVAQASEALTTNLGRAISELDSAIGGSSFLAKFLDTLSKGVRLSAGNLTDFERLNELTQERARVQTSLEQAQRRTVLSAKEQESYDTRLASINSQIVEIQDRRIGQIKDEGKEISGNSQKAAEARALTLAGLKEEKKLAEMTALARAQYKAEQALGIGASEDERKAARDLAAEIYTLNTAKNEAKKSTIGLTDAQRLAKQTAEQLERAQQSNADVISDLAEQLYQATLGADELIQRQNQLRLNEFATPEQIESVRLLSAELGKLKAAEEARQALAPVIQDLQIGNSGNAEIDRIMIEQQQKRDVLTQARLTEALDETAHAEALVLLDQQTAARRKEILDKQTADQQEAALSSAASIISITQAQVGQLQTLFEEGSAAGRAFFLVTQALAAANAIVQGIQAGMAIRVAYAQMAALSGPAAPALLAAGEVHANVATGMGFVSAGMIAAQTVASFDGGGFTGTGSRTGGLDGKGGFMAMMHPNETVIDHTKGQQMPGGSSGVTNNFIIEGQVDRRTQSQIAAKMAQEQQRSRARFSA